MKILLVDDDEIFCEATSQMLDMLGHEVATSHTMGGAQSLLNENTYDHLLLDFMLPDGSGLHLLERYKEQSAAPKITLITGHPSVRLMVSELAQDNVSYLLKPVRRENLEKILNGVQPKRVQSTKQTRHFDCLVGESQVMRELYELIERVSTTQANVMLLGESGAGKEVFAQAIHNASGAQKQMVATNCGAFSKELIGSELFGHEKGSFTGAVSKREGLFEQAHGGTLFLDEVTEMPIEEQPNLLRVLETNQVTRLGGSKVIDVQCRVISASNRSIEEIADGGVLREDLYFRLAVFPLSIPALRERKEDIPLLAQMFLDELNTEHSASFELTEEQLEKLSHHDWPGNVRELKHTLHRAFIMSDPSSKKLKLPHNFGSPFTKKPVPNTSVAVGKTIDEVEKELIYVTLEELDGDKTEAAKVLGISLKTLYNRLNRYGDSHA